MKAQKKLNVLLVVLTIILLSLISFVGIFYQEKNVMVSRIPEYILGTDLKGYRAVTLEVEEDSSTDSNSEESANELSSSESSINEVGEKTKNDNANTYRKCVDIFKARLKSLKVENYTISYDESSGKIEMTLPEDKRTDNILADLTQKGEFKIIDTQTQDVLMDNKDVSGVEILSNANYDGTYTAYMSIGFNLSGTNKLRKVSSTYQNQIINETTTTENTVNELAGEENVGEAEDSESEDSETEPAGKTIDMKIDDSTMMTTGFSTIIDSGNLNLSFGSSSSLEELEDKIYNAQNIAAIIENDPLPIQYNIEGNSYVKSTIDLNTIKIIIYVEIAVAALAILYLMIRFKARGILASIMSIGFLAILLLIVRYTNVTLSIEGIIAIEISFIIHIITQVMICKSLGKEMTQKEKKKEISSIVKRISLYLVPEVIFSIICCLSNYLSIFSVGMVIFWGVVVSWIYNYILLKFIA